MPTTPPSITALPTPPDPAGRSSFNTRAYPWSVAQQTFATEVAAVAANVKANADEAEADAVTAEAASAAAVGAAHYKGPWSTLTGALAIPASVSHSDAVWMLVSNTANVASITPGVSAQWLRLTSEPAAAPGLVLLATLTPTAAANVDALSVFSSTYDDYLITVSGVKPSADDALTVRLAVGGAVVSDSSYYTRTAAGPGVATNADYLFYVTTCHASGAGGTSMSIALVGANQSSGVLKQASGSASVQNSGSFVHAFNAATTAFAGGVVSGIRFYWYSGSNFAAQGTIRIYGYSKT